MKSKTLEPALAARLVQTLQRLGIPDYEIAQLKPVSPFAYSSGYGQTLQGLIRDSNPLLAQDLIAAAEDAAESSLLVAGEAALIAERGEVDTYESYSEAARKVLDATRPAEANAFREAQLAKVEADLDARTEALIAGRDAQQQALEQARRAGRQVSQSQTEATLFRLHQTRHTPGRSSSTAEAAVAP